jgi:riboflavin kinase/FMN adenylyltransferase
MAGPLVWWRLEDVPADFGPAALTIGNFDGVHCGHRALMRRTAAEARVHQWKASVLTFNPHPAKVVAPARAPRMITAFARRVELMGQEGIEQVLVLPFTEDVARWSAGEFVNLLLEKLGAKCVVIGDDFRFGHKQSGNRALLEEFGKLRGCDVIAVDPVNVRGERVSSSLIREKVGAGRIARAARLMGRPFELEGSVVTGQGIGSKQTVPTLNLEPDSEVLPLDGVYVTRTRDLNDGRIWDSITNVGVRPTFGGDTVTVETFLLSAFEPPAPVRIRVEFLRRVRDERKFESPEALKAQIFRDVQRAQRVHERLRKFRA